MIDNNKLKLIASSSRERIGEVEESVKINFVVPFLESFGHSRMEFEYKFKDIVLQKDVHKHCKVIVETKNYDKRLDGELAQLERYCNEERPLLGIIANGTEIRIYSYFWRRSSFEETLIFLINRNDLLKDSTVAELEKILSKENLLSGHARFCTDQRERAIEQIEKEIENIELSVKDKEKEIVLNIDNLKEKIKYIESEINDLQNELISTRDKERTQVGELWGNFGFISRVIPTQNVSPIPIRKDNQVKYARPNFIHENSVELLIHQSDIKYGIIQIPTAHRAFFPGFQVPFIMESDYGEFHLKVSSGKDETNIGDLYEGKYLTGKLQRLYKPPINIQEGDKIIIEMLEKHRRYRLKILS